MAPAQTLNTRSARAGGGPSGAFDAVRRSGRGERVTGVFMGMRVTGEALHFWKVLRGLMLRGILLHRHWLRGCSGLRSVLGELAHGDDGCLGVAVFNNSEPPVVSLPMSITVESRPKSMSAGGRGWRLDK